MFGVTSVFPNLNKNFQLTVQVFFSILIKLKKKMPCTQNTCGVAEAQGCACGAEEVIAVIEKDKKKKKSKRREREQTDEDRILSDGDSGLEAAGAGERNSCGLNQSCRSACIGPIRCSAAERHRYANDRKPENPNTSIIGLRSYGPVQQYPQVERVFWGQLGPHN